jgi:cytosine/adenosine deaminase-related metal-dependent hydrolase
VEDLGRGVLLPGFVNAHCHLELSGLAGVRSAGALGFVAWVERLVQARDALDAQELDGAAGEEAASLPARGTVAVGDVANRMGHLHRLDGVARLQATVFHEVIGWDAGRAPALLERALERVRAAPAGRTRLRLAAHAPHSVSAALLQALSAVGMGAIHLAESPAEAEFLRDGGGEWRGFLRTRGLGGVPFAPPGLGPVAYLDSLGVLRPGLLAAHCVQATDEDCALLAARGVRVVVCPRSNEALGVGPAPVPRLLEAGVRVCLGTDSLASAPTLDVLADAVALRRAWPRLPAQAVVRMLTVEGAAALDYPDLGTIIPGARAAFAFLPAERVPDDPCEFVLSGQGSARGVFP